LFNLKKEKIISIYYWFYRLWKHKILYLHKEVLWFFQRGFRGYSDSDVWSFDIYLAGVIGHGLKHLAKYNHGWPQSDEFPKPENWDKFLNELSHEFLKYHYEDIDPGYKEYKKFHKNFHAKILPKFIKHFGNYWD